MRYLQHSPKLQMQKYIYHNKLYQILKQAISSFLDYIFTFGSKVISGAAMSRSPEASGLSRLRDNRALEGLPHMTFPMVRSLASVTSCTKINLVNTTMSA